MDINWKGLLRYFRFWFLLILLLGVALILLKTGKNGGQPVRANTACVTEERVFDYADVLEAEEEESLRRLIARREAETGCDIVLVTLNESLEDYAGKYGGQTGTMAPSSYTMIYADNFYDEHLFGYNKPQGDGVILVDNWYREADGRVHSWFGTCGRAEDRFSDGMIDSLLDRALRDVDSDPAGAYEKYVNLFAEEMTGGVGGRIPVYAPLIAAAIATGLYIALNLGANRGEKTVNAHTYVTGKEPRMKKREDIFLRKSVTRRHIQRSSGSGGGGGGGHHISGGGVSHGGGGHSR